LGEGWLIEELKNIFLIVGGLYSVTALREKQDGG
jgi:hypothetical protein